MSAPSLGKRTSPERSIFGLLEWSPSDLGVVRNRERDVKSLEKKDVSRAEKDACGRKERVFVRAFVAKTKGMRPQSRPEIK